MRTLVRDKWSLGINDKVLIIIIHIIHLSEGKVNPSEIILHIYILYCVMPCVTKIIFLRSTIMYCKQETGSSLTPD